jgi:hypothetical protein
MKQNLSRLALLLVVLVLVVGLVGTALAKKPDKNPPSECSNDFFCIDVWDPVVCDDGKTYSNQCYADRACATGCEPAGPGPIPYPM